MLGKDFLPIKVFSTEFLVYEDKLFFVASDAEKNLHILTYAPQTEESCFGEQLMRRGDFHLGACVNAMVRTEARPYVFDKTGSPRKPLQHFVLMGTLDGGVAALIPFAEMSYRRLLMLQSRMHATIASRCGLNAKGFRMLRTTSPVKPPILENVIDGPWVYQFLWLPQTQQQQLAKDIGTTVDLIINDLLEVDMGSDVF